MTLSCATDLPPLADGDEDYSAPAAFEFCNQVSGDICTFLNLGGRGEDVASELAPALAEPPRPIELTGRDWDGDGDVDLVIDVWREHRVLVTELPAVANGDPKNVLVLDAFGSDADALNFPADISMGPDGSLFVADWLGQNVYRYAASSTPPVERDQLAGLCAVGCGDDVLGLSSTSDTPLAFPSSVQVHPDGKIFVAEAGCGRIRVLDMSAPSFEQVRPRECPSAVNLATRGTIETLAGRVDCTAAAGALPGSCQPVKGYAGDGGAARAAVFRVDSGPTVLNFGIHLSHEDPPHFLYVADTLNNVIRRIDLLATPPAIELFAGAVDEPGFVDGDRLSEARFNRPSNVYVSPQGDVYSASAANGRVRKIDGASGLVTTIAGNGYAGFDGDNQPAVRASLNQPHGMWLHPDGRLFIADSMNSRIRVVMP